MKVYFACSITGGRENAHLYQAVVDAIKNTGAELLSELFASSSINAKEGIGVKHDMTKHEVWKWDLDWLSQADAIVAEVTQPSLGVGYEIAKAEEAKKPILCLFYEPSDRRLSSMIEGSPHVDTVYYRDKSQMKTAVKDFLDKYK